MIVGAICFKNIVEMLSNPQDALFGKLSILFETFVHQPHLMQIYSLNCLLSNIHNLFHQSKQYGY